MDTTKKLKTLNVSRVEKNWLVYGKTHKCFAAKHFQNTEKCRVVYQIGIFRSIGWYFSVLPIPIPENISVGIFGIKTLAGAAQKIGESPLFPNKGGSRPLFEHCPPFEEKRNSRGIFQKKSSREILKRCSRQSLQYNNTAKNTEPAGCI